MEDLLQAMVSARQLSAPDAERAQEVFRNRILNEVDVLRWLAEAYDVPYANLDDMNIDSQFLTEFSPRILLKYELLPLRRSEKGIEVALCRLFESEGIDALKLMTNENISPVLAPASSIRHEIKKRLGVGADTLDSIEAATFIPASTGGIDGINLSEADGEASIIRFVNQILRDALAQRTTDIHIEPFEDELRIRYRIDGILQPVPVPALVKHFQSAIISRIKILSNLDIAEKRIPQDGRLKVNLGRDEVDVRVSVIPMIYGEAVVLRLLRQDGQIRGLSELDMGDRELRLFRRLLELPNGIILVTGPTGSGKTTTLYAALQEINQTDRKIITIEDPVEYQLKGVNQIQINEKAGLTFARGLRSILRHDPDIVLVGEIRDAETARIAVQASLTGHLVFSTLHTNDSPSAVTRLIDMGIEPYLVASSVQAVMAQRLVRVLCSHCKQEAPDTPLAETTLAYIPAGCDECRHTGFHGRRAIFEMMPLTESLRQVVLRAGASVEIRDAARKQGWTSLYEDGLRIVRSGGTSLQEILRVTTDVTTENNW